jgi:hypothetical protein
MVDRQLEVKKLIAKADFFRLLVVAVNHGVRPVKEIGGAAVSVDHDASDGAHYSFA